MPTGDAVERSHVTDSEWRVPDVSADANQFWLHPCRCQQRRAGAGRLDRGLMIEQADADREEIGRAEHESIDHTGEEILRVDLRSRFGTS